MDLSHLVLADTAVQQTILNGTGASTAPPPSLRPNIRQLFYEILLFFAHTYNEVFGLTRGPPLHDPIAVAVLLDSLSGSAKFDDRGGERWRVEVVTDGQHSNIEAEQRQVGRTVVSAVDPAVDGLGVRIPRGIDIDWFWASLEECMQRAEEAISTPQTLEASSP